MRFKNSERIAILVAVAAALTLILAPSTASAGRGDGAFCIKATYKDGGQTATRGTSGCGPSPAVSPTPEPTVPPRITPVNCVLDVNKRGILNRATFYWDSTREMEQDIFFIQQKREVKLPGESIRKEYTSPDGSVRYSATFTKQELASASLPAMVMATKYRVDPRGINGAGVIGWGILTDRFWSHPICGF